MGFAAQKNPLILRSKGTIHNPVYDRIKGCAEVVQIRAKERSCSRRGGVSGGSIHGNYDQTWNPANCKSKNCHEKKLGNLDLFHG